MPRDLMNPKAHRAEPTIRADSECSHGERRQGIAKTIRLKEVTAVVRFSQSLLLVRVSRASGDLQPILEPMFSSGEWSVNLLVASG
jgi:hypothetical protein